MEYFEYSEFDQKGLPGSGEEFMDIWFLEKLNILRGKCGFPIIITSGYRSPEYNADVSSTGLTGPHTTGKAADIAVDRGNAYCLLSHAMNRFGGIGINQKGDDRFIHLDDLTAEEAKAPRPTIWSY